MMSDIGYLLKVIQENTERHANQIFKPVDVTSSQVRIMKYLRSREGRMAQQKEIEDYFQVSHPTVVGIVQRLEQKGFVRSEYDQKDKRKKNIYLTEKENQLYEQMKKSHEQLENLLTNGMSEEQVSKLKELLRLVLENVKEREET